jgi:hypothetical protein
MVYSEVNLQALPRSHRGCDFLAYSIRDAHVSDLIQQVGAESLDGTWTTEERIRIRTRISGHMSLDYGRDSQPNKTTQIDD